MKNFAFAISIFSIACSTGTDDFYNCIFCGGNGGQGGAEESSSSTSLQTSSNNSTNSITTTSVVGSSTNGSSCNPTTCLAIAISLNNGEVEMWDGSTPKACGVFDDGCGSFVECTQNSNDPTGDEQCGPGKWCGAGRLLDGGIHSEGVPGLCDGNCVFQGVCENGARQQYICSGETEESPVFLYSPSFENCDPVAMGAKSTQWCCAFTP